MNKKTALFLSAILFSGLTTSPVMADSRKDDDDNRGRKSSMGEMRFKMEDRDDDDFKGKFDDDKFKNINKNPDFILKMDIVQKSIESKNYADFTKALTDAGIKETITEAQFNILVEAYTKAKSGDIKGAQDLLKNNNLSPVLHRFVMGQHMSLTDAQKTALKQAEELVKQGKVEEAKAILDTAGLPKPPIQNPVQNLKKEELKTVLEKARQLKSEGKTEEAQKVLSDAGIPEKASEKLEKELNKEFQKERTSLVKVFKNFFKIGKNK